MRISDWSSDVCSSDLSPAVGILSITRHPFLWGTGLWALSHLLANGDLGSIVMMGGIAILSFGGMQHIDQRRESHLGASWGPMKLTTSEIGRAHVGTPVTNAHLVCRLMPEKKKTKCQLRTTAPYTKKQ